MNGPVSLAATAAKLDEIGVALKDSRSLLVLTHDNPDPDSISSAICLSYIVTKRFGIPSRVAYGGIVGRAENRTMVKRLRLKIYPLNDRTFKRFPHVALVDTQPQTGNNSLPRSMTPVIVIDHHPLRKATRGQVLDVRQGYGATATLLTEYLFASGLEIPKALATALFYGISSETQHLGRETSPLDRWAYLELFPQTDKRALSEIEHPKLSTDFFESLHTALTHAFTHRRLIGSRLGAVTNPDLVPQFADMFLLHEGMNWSICLGRHNQMLLISVRTTNQRAEAGRLMQKLVGKLGRAGGHSMLAGGRIDLTQLKENEHLFLEEDLLQRFCKLIGYRDSVTFKPLIQVPEGTEGV